MCPTSINQCPPNNNKQGVSGRIRSVAICRDNLNNFPIPQIHVSYNCGNIWKGNKLAKHWFKIYCQEALWQWNTLPNTSNGWSSRVSLWFVCQKKMYSSSNHKPFFKCICFVCVATLTWGNPQGFINSFFRDLSALFIPLCWPQTKDKRFLKVISTDIISEWDMNIYIINSNDHCYRFGFNKVFECTLRAKSGNSSSLYNRAMAEKIASVQIKACFEEDNILVEFQSALRAHRSTENCCSFNKLRSLDRKQVLCFAHSKSRTVNKEIFAFNKWWIKNKNKPRHDHMVHTTCRKCCSAFIRNWNIQTQVL